MSDHGVNIQDINNSSINANIIAGRDVIQIYVQSSSSEPNGSSDSTQFHFDCGHRLKIVRNALGLNCAQFITLLNYPSEKGWSRIEQCEQEASDTLIKNVASLSGVSAQWIRTGEEPMFPVSYYSLQNTTEFWKELEAQHTTAVFLFLCDTYEDTHVVAQVGPYAYKGYALDFGLNFWRWIEAYGYIPLALQLLRGILQRYYLACNVVYLPKPIYEQFEQGTLHPHTVLHQQKVFKHFLNDLFHNTGDEYTLKQYGRNFKKLMTYLAQNKVRFG